MITSCQFSYTFIFLTTNLDWIVHSSLGKDLAFTIIQLSCFLERIKFGVFYVLPTQGPVSWLLGCLNSNFGRWWNLLPPLNVLEWCYKEQMKLRRCSSALVSLCSEHDFGRFWVDSESDIDIILVILSKFPHHTINKSLIHTYKGLFNFCPSNLVTRLC